MKHLTITLFILILFPLSAFPFIDDSHYSVTFKATRFFRVFVPPDYDQNNTTKRYPVIYYFHGCGGTYSKSGTYSYADFGLTPPNVIGRTYDPSYDFPNNVDFENFTYENDVIIICADGKIEGLGGCGVFFPSLAENWNDHYYNFPNYIRELIEVVDERYNTMVGTQYRAISGLSMGGHMAILIAAKNPHLFGSASQFCHSPTYFNVGEPIYQTTIDMVELWRNLRGLPFRHSTNDRDYLRFYSEQLYYSYSGAGFENQYYLADYGKHHAARVDLQFAFHMDHFTKPKNIVKCFSHMNLYPEFEIWDYKISSQKKGNGWIYLHNVSKNGAGIYTRERLPWGKSLPDFNITVTTPGIYNPNGIYTISRYSYRTEKFSIEKIIADLSGQLTITSVPGIGEEIGITGEGIQPAVFILTDTINENIYLKDNIDTPVGFEIINLSLSSQTVDIIASTENKEILEIIKPSARVTIPALAKIKVDTLFTCRGKIKGSYNNKAYIKLSASSDGKIQDREHYIPVIIVNYSMQPEASNVKIFDGRTEELPLFKYGWREWDNPLSTGILDEGMGNGNGKAEPGELFSIWIKLPAGFDSSDINTWHPTIPMNNKDNPDVSVEGIKHHKFNTGRDLVSAQIRLNRKPTKDHPVRIPIQTELLKVERLQNSTHRPTADNFKYAWYNIVITEDGTARLESPVMISATE